MANSKKRTDPISNRDNQIGRLKAMVADNQQTWDLSPNDVAAIRMALAAIHELVAAIHELEVTHKKAAHGCYDFHCAECDT